MNRDRRSLLDNRRSRLHSPVRVVPEPIGDRSAQPRRGRHAGRFGLNDEAVVIDQRGIDADLRIAVIIHWPNRLRLLPAEFPTARRFA